MYVDKVRQFVWNERERCGRGLREGMTPVSASVQKGANGVQLYARE